MGENEAFTTYYALSQYTIYGIYIHKQNRSSSCQPRNHTKTHTHFHVHMLTRLLIEEGKNMEIPKCNGGAAAKKVHWNNNIQIETRKETRG